MRGKIIKGVGGFYDVHVPQKGVYACRAKGIFRKENIKPLVGDEVSIQILDEKDREGSIQEILPRKNQLVRPAVSNVDQAVLLCSLASPSPNYMLLDRFLVTVGIAGIPACLCFNKKDLGKPEELAFLEETYGRCSCPVVFTSAQDREGIEELDQLLEGKTTVFAGPSGVGKSSLANLLQRDVYMETGTVSKKLGRGRHTTRHSQLIPIRENTYLVDTPGFTSLYLEGIGKEELKSYYPEFFRYEGQCRFQGCAHISEPGCAVQEALEQGKISPLRYRNYRGLFEELKNKRRY